MPDADNYALTTVADGVPEGLPLVMALTGFADAGSTSAQFIEFVRTELQGQAVAVFNNDQLLDYRARRPTVLFDQDDFRDYTAPRLELVLADDEMGQPFLALLGYEPDMAWEGFTDSVMDLVERFRVSGVSWIQGVPMPVPHTRSLGVVVTGTRADLVERLTAWRTTMRVQATPLHRLHGAIRDTGRPVSGFAVLVPHYLSETEFPEALVTAINSVSAAEGLILPTDTLREAGRAFLTKVEEQIADNDELQRLVSALEQRYDTEVADSPARSPFTDGDGELPSADEIAAELERFLSGRRDEGPGTGIA
ncbi:MAG: proteasome assembly chaperone family protein [Mycetocola sp.]